jgi:phosphatidate phosphatase
MKSIRGRLALSWKNLSFFYRLYFINLSFLHIFMTVTKLSTGSHRPHFFETCQPDKLANCSSNSYVYDFKCTNTKYKGFYLYDSFMSFFSGHALLLAYSSFFVILYLHYRLRAKKFTFWLPFMQALLISFAFFGSISRVFDNRHHVVDISVGAIIGVLASLHIWFTQCKKFKFNDVSDNEEKYEIHDGNDEILPVNSSSCSS